MGKLMGILGTARPPRLAAALLALTCAACGAPGATDTPGARVTALADRYVAAYFDAFPEDATEAGVAAFPTPPTSPRSSPMR